MRVLALALLLAAPAAAQDLPEAAEPPSLMERGMTLFMEGLMREMEPALRDLEDLSRDAQPLFERLEGELGEALRDLGGLGAYDLPEILPNGDIILRRKEPLPDDVERNPDGSVDL